MKTKFRKNKAGVSAVIGVILMVAITVAIAATVYVYVSGMLASTDDDIVEKEVEIPRYIYQNHSGILKGCWIDVDDKDPIRIGDNTIHDVYISEEETKYLLRFLGEDITLILVEYQTDVWFDYGKGDLVYIGAYLN